MRRGSRWARPHACRGSLHTRASICPAAGRPGETAVRVGIGIGGGRDGWEESASFLQEAERLGVDSAWTSETWGFDAFTPLAYMAGKSSRIKLGTSIAQAGTRTPAVIAMTALALTSLSNDRFS